MSLKTFKIISSTNSELETEIPFYVASARAEKAEIIKLVIPVESERFLTVAKRILRSLKRESRIQLFEEAKNLKSDTTEARYLRNKYPMIAASQMEEEPSIIVKL